MSARAYLIALADSPVANWFGRTGKVLLLVAGLAILLDLTGREQIAGWADTAIARRQSARRMLAHLRTARPLILLMDTMHRCVDRGVRLESRRFTATEFDAFARRTRTDVGAEAVPARRFPRWLWPNKDAMNKSLRDHVARDTAVHDRVRSFLTEHLEHDDRVALIECRPLLARTSIRHGTATKAAYILVAFGMVLAVATVVVSGAIAQRSGSPETAVFVRALLALFAVMMVVPLAALLLFRTMLSTTAVLLAGAAGSTIRLWLARIALALIGPEKAGHPLRWAALVAFLTGSLLDLIVSW